MQHTVLVTGGAGYIGSHTTRQLLHAGHRVLVVDNLYSGNKWAVPEQAAFVELDVGNRDTVRRLMHEYDVTAVIHFAGHIVVPESVSDPAKYYGNNVVNSFHVIQACRDTGVRHFIFSSSAAVYGTPARIPVDENADTAPINPYGFSKLTTEWMLQDLTNSDRINNKPASQCFNHVALRYFNVAGAALDGSLGQATPQATHLIKVACEAACGKRDQIAIFGSDYDTEDGTCIRDYIHVEDLAKAHVTALEYLRSGGESQTLNCGYGRGFSVRDVLDTVQKVSNTELNLIEAPRRRGDPPILVADKTKIHEVLNWEPDYDDLELICGTAYKWERKLATFQQKHRGQTKIG
jgi:UDP-glucose 4-epimerase